MKQQDTESKESMIFSDQYDRYCRQIDKEDGLVDQRINWLLLSQSILFAAIGVSGQEVAKITLRVIPLVGIVSSLIIGVSVLAALLSLLRYREILMKVCPPKEDSDFSCPQLHRSRLNIGLGLVSPIALPILFCTAWILVIVLVAR